MQKQIPKKRDTSIRRARARTHTCTHARTHARTNARTHTHTPVDKDTHPFSGLLLRKLPEIELHTVCRQLPYKVHGLAFRV